MITMTISFFTGRAVINAFLSAFQRAKSNQISTYYFSASAVVKPEYLQEISVKYSSDNTNLEYCGDDEKDGNINVINVHDAPDMTSFCGKLFLIDPDHIKKTVIQCFNQRVRKGHNPNYQKAVMAVCYTLLEMPMWWYFVTTAVNFKELNRRRKCFDSEDVVIFTYQCCENIRPMNLIHCMFEWKLMTDEANGFYGLIDNLAFNDMNNVYYSKNGVERERKIVDIEGVKHYKTPTYWYETTDSMEYILHKGRIDNE